MVLLWMSIVGSLTLAHPTAQPPGVLSFGSNFREARMGDSRFSQPGYWEPCMRQTTADWAHLLYVCNTAGGEGVKAIVSR
jgi:hypothetical protein